MKEIKPIDNGSEDMVTIIINENKTKNISTQEEPLSLEDLKEFSQDYDDNEKKGADSSSQKKPKKLRNLSICPLTPDPPEILELIAELKGYLKTVDCDFIGTYEAHFNFYYDGITYKMDSYALSASPDQLFRAKDQIAERLIRFGASNIQYSDRWD